MGRSTATAAVSSIRSKSHAAETGGADGIGADHHIAMHRLSLRSSESDTCHARHRATGESISTGGRQLPGRGAVGTTKTTIKYVVSYFYHARMCHSTLYPRSTTRPRPSEPNACSITSALAPLAARGSFAGGRRESERVRASRSTSHWRPRVLVTAMSMVYTMCNRPRVSPQM